MAFARASAVRGALRATRTSRPVVARPQVWQQLGRRTYANGHSAEKGSDLPWFIGAVAITVPTCFFLLRGGDDHGHGAPRHEVHFPKKQEKKDDSKAEEASEKKSDDLEAKAESKDEEKSDDSAIDSEGKDVDTPETSDDEEASSKDGENVPDAKGDNKKRIESAKGMKQGEVDDTVEEGAPKDKAASSKEAGSQNTQSGKQEGLSNTDTKHSIDVTHDSEKSKKGEGIPESSKSKGTVDVNRPQPEQEKGSDK